MENLLFNMQAHQFVATIRGVLASETSDLQPLAVVIEDAEQEEIDDIAALQTRLSSTARSPNRHVIILFGSSDLAAAACAVHEVQRWP